MSNQNSYADALGIHLTGGATNTDPDASLGGVISSQQLLGLGALLSSSIPSLRIDHAFPANGEGLGELQLDVDGSMVWTPPGGVQGDPVPIADGETKLVSGADVSKAVLVTKEAGLLDTNPSHLDLKIPLNGSLVGADVTNAQRTAGVTTYRGVVLTAKGVTGVLDLRAWLPSIAGAQATFSIAWEVVVGGAIQTIADELTAPTGLSWSSPTTEGAAISQASLVGGDSIGLWIRRVFPVGTVAPQENVQLALKYWGAGG